MDARSRPRGRAFTTCAADRCVYVCVHVYVAVRVYVSLYVFARSRLS